MRRWLVDRWARLVAPWRVLSDVEAELARHAVAIAVLRRALARHDLGGDNRNDGGGGRDAR